jgi:nucleotidyltransferase substrate binding protein (TIGR01987 family)
MAKTFELKLKDFGDALERLKEACAQEKNEFVRDSIIKRFEFAYELAWRTAKIFLSQTQGVESFSPKEVFRELKRNDFIFDDKVERLLAMTDDRNAIVHTYDLNFSEKLADKIITEYFDLLAEVCNIIKNNK